MAQGVKVPSVKPEDLSLSLGPTRWKERSNSKQLSLEFQCVPWHMYAPPRTNKIKT